MAENLLFRITMIADKRGGDATLTHLNVGGQFASYYDDSDGSIIVRDLADDSELLAADFIPSGFTFNILNGNTDYISSPPQEIGDFGLKQAAESSYSVCEAFDLKKFRLDVFAAYPFAASIVEENSSECQIDGFTCDLQIESFDVVKDDGTGNGSISVTATSQGDIEYGLAEFTYGNGSIGFNFNNLNAGNYTVYVVDEYNCTAQINVTVGLQGLNDYGLLYRIGYQDINGNDGRFDIEEKLYVGASTEVTSSGSPLMYDNQEKDQFDIFKQPIKASNVKVNLPELTKFGYRDLFTQDSKKYLGIWYKDVGSGYVELWRGFLQPEIFSAPYGYQPDISLTFIDQLNRLSKFNYADDNYLYSSKSLIKIIADGLRRTSLELPINVAINMYEDSHNATATDDPFDQTYLDQEAFYDDGEAQNYFKVIERILQPFGAKLLQWEGAWWIVRVEELKGNSIDYRSYDENGDYLTNSSFNPRIELRRSCVTDARAVITGATYEILPSPKKLIIENQLIQRESLLENHDFNRDEQFWNLNKSGTTVTGQINKLNDNRSYRFNNSGWTNNLRGCHIAHSQENIEYLSEDKIKVSFDVAVDIISNAFPYMIIKARVIVGNYYLLEDGTWTTTVSDCRFYPSLSNGFQQVEIIANAPPETTLQDTTLNVWIYDYQAKNPDFGNYVGGALQSGEAAFLAFQTTDLPIATKRTVYSNFTGSSFLHFYTLQEGTDVTSEPDIIRPSDYASSTNERIWVLDGYVKIDVFPNAGLAFDLLTATSNQFYYVDNVVIEVLPNGEETPKKFTISAPVGKNEEDLEYNLSIIDLPDKQINSAKYQYNNLLLLASGNNTQNWTRDGVDESTTIQKVFSQVVARQYSTPSGKISGNITTNNINGTHIDVTPLSSFVETQDEGKIYILNGITIQDKLLDYQVNLVDSKATASFGLANGTCDAPDGSGGDDNDGGNGGSFNGAFTSGFGAGFNIIFSK